MPGALANTIKEVEDAISSNNLAEALLRLDDVETYAKIYLENGKNYILKFAGSTEGFKNVNISYTTSPMAEYVGSHIYSELGIDVHRTVLGKHGPKLVVACEDFCKKNERLYHFGELKVTFEPTFLDSNGNETNGTGTDLEEVLQTIDQHPVLRQLDGTKERFWDMFVIDALIENVDRNNGNWGVIVSDEQNVRLAPVFDNGNSFNNKFNDEKMKELMKDDKSFKTIAYSGFRNIFELQNKRINPYQFINKMGNKDCNDAVLRIVPKIYRKITPNTKEHYANTGRRSRHFDYQ